jgi:VanZ family protein
MRLAHCEHVARPVMLSAMPPLQRSARLLILLGWMALLTYWSGQGNLPIDQPGVAGPLHGLQHRVAHLFAFGLLGLLGRWAFDGWPRAFVLAVLVTSAFGLSDEWHQSFTPGRRPAIDDWAFDTASAALAVSVWSRLNLTRWQAWLRTLAPAAVGAAFLFGIGLAIPARIAPTGVQGLGVRSFSSQAAYHALQFMRETRDVARHVRSTFLS